MFPPKKFPALPSGTVLQQDFYKLILMISLFGKNVNLLRIKALLCESVCLLAADVYEYIFIYIRPSHKGKNSSFLSDTTKSTNQPLVNNKILCIKTVAKICEF